MANFVFGEEVLLEDILRLIGEAWEGTAVVVSDKPYTPLWIEDYAKCSPTGEVFIYKNGDAYEAWRSGRVRKNLGSRAHILWSPGVITVVVGREPTIEDGMSLLSGLKEFHRETRPHLP